LAAAEAAGAAAVRGGCAAGPVSVAKRRSLVRRNDGTIVDSLLALAN
jgi:hypothetical protein